MIIALMAVSRLHGMESSHGYTLKSALNHCIESGQGSMVACFYSDEDKKRSPDTKIEDLVAGLWKSDIGTKFSESSTIQLHSGIENGVLLAKFLSKDRTEWIDSRDYKYDGDNRVSIECNFCDIVDDKSAEHFIFDILRKRRAFNIQTPILIYFNTSRVIDEFDIVSILSKCDVQFGRAPENIVRLCNSQGQELNNKDFQSNNSIVCFFTNHWGKLAGVSLIGILAFYYKFVR